MRKIYPQVLAGKLRSGDPDHHRSQRVRDARPAGPGRLPQRGFVRQEEVSLDDFLGNRFGSVYAQVEQARAA